MTYSNPRYVNAIGGILLMQNNGIEIYVGTEGDLHSRAIAGEFGSIAPYAEPQPPTQEELLSQERANMVCTRQQGKLALGPTVWASVLALADDPDTPWGLRVAIEDTVEWRRTDEDMQALIWAMGLTEEQADDLFRLAMTL